MKKAITLLLSLCIVITSMPLTVYASSTPEISLEAFTDAVTEIEEKYDSADDQFSTMMFNNGSEFYYIDGEDYLHF